MGQTHFNVPAVDSAIHCLDAPLVDSIIRCMIIPIEGRVIHCMDVHAVESTIYCMDLFVVASIIHCMNVPEVDVSAGEYHPLYYVHAVDITIHSMYVPAVP